VLGRSGPPAQANAPALLTGPARRRLRRTVPLRARVAGRSHSCRGLVSSATLASATSSPGRSSGSALALSPKSSRRLMPARASEFNGKRRLRLTNPQLASRRRGGMVVSRTAWHRVPEMVCDVAPAPAAQSEAPTEASVHPPCARCGGKTPAPPLIATCPACRAAARRLCVARNTHRRVTANGRDRTAAREWRTHLRNILTVPSRLPATKQPPFLGFCQWSQPGSNRRPSACKEPAAVSGRKVG
jgi:hypothetical protein